MVSGKNEMAVDEFSGLSLGQAEFVYDPPEKIRHEFEKTEFHLSPLMYFKPRASHTS